MANEDGNNVDTAKISVLINVEHDEETMPVRVHGLESSDKLILTVHGGPGSDVMDYRDYLGGEAFRALEEKYTIAYWQQRASGLSQGPDNTQYYTIPQYAEDCGIVVDSLIARYPNKEIVMLGHSWGGMLSSYYLRDANQRSKISAWIDCAGVTNGTILFDTSQDDLNTHADYRISIGENVNYWNNVKNQIAGGNIGIINSISYSCVDYIPEVLVKVPQADFTFTQRAFNRVISKYFQC